jgi:hypothetical protein
MGEAGGRNLYGFCHNDGVNLYDETGMCYSLNAYIQSLLAANGYSKDPGVASLADMVAMAAQAAEQGGILTQKGTPLTMNNLEETKSWSFGLTNGALINDTQGAITGTLAAIPGADQGSTLATMPLPPLSDEARSSMALMGMLMFAPLLAVMAPTLPEVGALGAVLGDLGSTATAAVQTTLTNPLAQTTMYVGALATTVATESPQLENLSPEIDGAVDTLGEGFLTAAQRGNIETGKNFFGALDTVNALSEKTNELSDQIGILAGRASANGISTPQSITPAPMSGTLTNRY